MVNTNVAKHRRSPLSIRLISLVFTVASFAALTTVAQDTAPVSEAPAQPQVEHGSKQAPEAKPETLPKPAANPEKMIKATALLAAVAGIAVFGVGAIAVTMLWAKHLRRVARDLGPPQKTMGNDFWFLKPPKPNAMESEITDSHRPPHTPPETEAPE